MRAKTTEHPMVRAWIARIRLAAYRANAPTVDVYVRTLTKPVVLLTKPGKVPADAKHIGTYKAPFDAYRFVEDVEEHFGVKLRGKA